ncbi:hypothetical protein PybrP1_004074 [[Pythium] brassicae (nom. inval.)]|nr:hypothetical protein PybrP1_004074 [[Pythium] brassicae (nom. inval.)]
MTDSVNHDDVPVDIWRDSPVRFLGYANELGESFRPVAPRFVVPSYALAFAYVLGDTAHKATRATANAPPDASRTALGAAAALDTLIWQTLASVAIPGFTINRVVALSSAVIERTAKNSPVVRRWTPTAIGLGVIPFIVHPIDRFVDALLDETTRKWAASFSSKKGE